MNKQELLNDPLVRQIAEEYRNFIPHWSRGESAFQQYIDKQQPKKEWEILSFEYPQYKDVIYKLHSNRLYIRDMYLKCSNQKDFMHTLESFKTDLENKQCHIHSVKRLSDQEVFTIGDKVQFCHNGYPLGDTYSELIIPGFHNKDCVWNILTQTARDNIFYDQVSNRKNFRLWFSTKEAVEEYILMNKPCLSINDIRYLLKFKWELTEFKNLVKSKL